MAFELFCINCGYMSYWCSAFPVCSRRPAELERNRHAILTRYESGVRPPHAAVSNPAASARLPMGSSSTLGSRLVTGLAVALSSRRSPGSGDDLSPAWPQPWAVVDPRTGGRGTVPDRCLSRRRFRVGLTVNGSDVEGDDRHAGSNRTAVAMSTFELGRWRVRRSGYGAMQLGGAPTLLAGRLTGRRPSACGGQRSRPGSITSTRRSTRALASSTV